MRSVWREWIAPVASASAICLAIAAAVQNLGGPGDRPAAGASTRGTSPARTRQVPQGGPRFVVVVRRPGATVAVRDARTGAPAGEVPPAGGHRRYREVAAVSDGSYLISAYQSARHRVSFLRLRLSADGRPLGPTPVPKITAPGTARGVVVSQDGERLAYVARGKRKGLQQIHIVSLDTGRRSVWTTRLHGDIGSLSWAGTSLSFLWVRRGAGTPSLPQVRTLDTTLPAGDLKASTRLVGGTPGVEMAMISPDGGTVVLGTGARSGDATELDIVSFSRTTGQSRVLWHRRLTGQVHWTSLSADASGRHLLAMSTAGSLYVDPAAGTRRVPTGPAADGAW